jgi:hypothetical protein
MAAVKKVFLAPAENWAPGSVPSNPAERRIVSLPDPKAGKPRKYLVVFGPSPTILELQHQQPTVYASWFVDQTVISGERGGASFFFFHSLQSAVRH